VQGLPCLYMCAVCDEKAQSQLREGRSLAQKKNTGRSHCIAKMFLIRLGALYAKDHYDDGLLMFELYRRSSASGIRFLL
jgi:hypothetical protein